MTRFLIAALGVAGCASPHSYVVPVLDDAPSFTIEVEGSTGPGRVTGAALEGDSLVIGYTYPAPEGQRTGQLRGQLEGIDLEGAYDTRGPGTSFQGPLRMTFRADGSADGVWNDGEGTVALVPPVE